MTEEHPLISATRALLPAIDEAAEEIEKNQRVPDELIKKISDAGLFSTGVPREFGGPEVDPLVVFDALELIGQVDASTAWVILIISANNYLFGNTLHEHVWQAMYGENVNTRTAGSLLPVGKAVKTEGGYRVSGRLKYGSGSEHCEYLLSGCMVFEGDSLCKKENGEAETIWVIHKTSDCEIHLDSWDSTGLRGSSSHDYSLDDVFVPADWTFVLGETVHELANPLYGFPGIVFCQLSGITLGMARTCLNILKDMAVTKRRGPVLMAEDPSIQLRVAEAEAKIGAARAWIKQVVSDLLETLKSGDELSWDQRAKYRLACTYALDCATEVVDMMYKNAGGGGVYKPNKLDRNLRDIHTAATHLRFNDLTYIKAGKMMLGQDPEDPLF